MNTLRGTAIPCHETNIRLFKKNHTTIQTARSASIASENDEKIKRALSHNIRTSS